ncbi:polynucleotide adenylyltransferase PcnB [Spirochaeta lutea]|uniref:polynucleotide adenylyltransferase PcnB n=1 Tax=Spirochaeta lutea TaxID=1480694 RepID=UPI00068B53CA|nr:polynucleotide adenylyltransferase PcnB [Spirochaeta lutea]
MLIRYKTGPRGKPVPQARIYVKEEHSISRDGIDFDAVKIIRRLQRQGYEAYVVGGAVRDLLFRRQPKDFDIATSAEPNQIRKLFRNSRIIGKRFRLVHIFFQNQKIIEVATFRAAEAEGFNNVYGDVEEDAFRRDFTMNGLYYDPVKEQVLDFHTGFQDIRNRRLVPIIPLKRIFREDPVRMIRAVKYAVTTGCSIGWNLGRRIRRESPLLQEISASRLSEELFKILQSGNSRAIFSRLMDYRLFQYLLPGFQTLFEEQGEGVQTSFFSFLDTLDQHVQNDGEVRRSRFIAFLCADYFYNRSPWKDEGRNVFPLAYQGIKECIKPLTPANRDVEQAVVFLMRQKKRYRQSGVLLNTLEKASRPSRGGGAKNGGDPASGTVSKGSGGRSRRSRRKSRPASAPKSGSKPSKPGSQKPDAPS